MIIFSAPSGAGKTTIVKAVLEKFSQLEFSVSACSRPKRKNEADGKDYYFLTPEEFKSKIKNEEFIEWEEVYPNSYYGTLKSELNRIWSKKKHVIFDIDVKGGLNIKQKYSKQAIAIFIMPPDLKTLSARLQKRNTENSESLNNRLDKAAQEISSASKFDVIIINEIIDKAKNEACDIVDKFLKNEN